MKRILTRLIILPIIFSIMLLHGHVQAAPNIIHAVLFISDTCPRCHDVITYVLPPLVEKYPGQLDIVGVKIEHPVGRQLFEDMLTIYNVPDNRIGVPTLVVDATVLVGTYEIEATFPEIIQSRLADGGVDWPQIPGLDQVLAAQVDTSAQIAQASTPSNDPAPSAGSIIIERLKQDLLANIIAVFVLIGMLFAGASVVSSYLKGSEYKYLEFPDWALPVLAVVGLGVASYLAYIEMIHVDAVCGPVGNCNTVQQSSYALLFGILPIGLLGVAGYLALLFAWLMAKFGPISLKRFFTLAIWGMTWFGLLFSIYLTYLEPFVIGATCAWCITSAILMTLILLVSTEPAKQSLKIEIDKEEMEGEEFNSEFSVKSE